MNKRVIDISFRGLKHNAEAAANNLLKELGLLNTNCIDVHYILNTLVINNHKLGIYSDNLEGVKGYTLHKDGRFMVCYDPNNFHRHNVRFTIAHEIGHIYLGHFKKNITSNQLYGQCEYEANYFAAALLMPEHLLSQYNTLSSEEISNRLDVSTESLGYRLNTLHSMKKHLGFHIYLCSTCGNLIYGKCANYCAQCGIEITL